ncbi:MAG: hypothetical protein R3E96_08655 [Planctomycetota bacterium]
MIAAMACDPEALIADEPDHRARRDDPGADPRPDPDLQKDTGMSVLLITHDPRRGRGDRAPRGGDVRGPRGGVRRRQDPPDAPRHPYTKGCCCVQAPDMVAPGERLTTIPGTCRSAERFPGLPPAPPPVGGGNAAAQSRRSNRARSTEHLAACFFLEEAREL